MRFKFLKEAAVIFILTAASGILYQSFLPNGLDIIYQPTEIPEGRIIDIQTLKQFLLRKKAALIDVRPAPEYNAGHIPGALNLPLKSPRNHKIEFVNRYDRNQIFIVYCSNVLCNQAERLAGELKMMGYQNTLIFEEGLEGWLESGMPAGKNE